MKTSYQYSKHLMPLSLKRVGPFSYTIIFGQLVRIGPSSWKWAALWDFCLGLQAWVGPQQPESNHMQALAWAHFMYCVTWTTSLHRPIKHTMGCHMRLLHGPSLFAVSGIAAETVACIGPQWDCHDLANEVKLGHNSLKALLFKPLNGPISCTMIFGLLARIGPQQPEYKCTQALAWAHFVYCNILTAGSLWPTKYTMGCYTRLLHGPS